MIDVGSARSVRTKTAHRPYRQLAGEPLTIAAQVLADRIGGELLTVPGFYPHVQEPETVNHALQNLWSRA
ncbi:hypothetical protein [Saccharopolyspora sp. NPDC049426]|uniref:hypothetical protein n=1 Tax=Saccharopolyspora sp. NPDC049426 TaxID=3155652 RepID=UPI003436D833